MGRKIAIVAKAATVAFAPFEDPEWEVWGMPWIIYRRTPDLYFETHAQACWDGTKETPEELTKWQDRVNATDVPIYSHPSRLHLFRNGREFPYDAVSRICAIPFFENSIAYQLGFALLEHSRTGVDEVGLYGVNMMGESEYHWERASVTYLVGLLQGSGIKVTVPPGAALFMSKWIAGRYGETAEKRFEL